MLILNFYLDHNKKILKFNFARMAGLLHSITSGSFFLYSAVHFCLILQCSMFPKSTHETFAHKLYQTFKTHKRFIKPKLSRTDFTISHYAGEVNASCFVILAVLP
jgi:hypothetical protein